MPRPPMDFSPELAPLKEALASLVTDARTLVAHTEQLTARHLQISELVGRASKQIFAVMDNAIEEAQRARRDADATIATATAGAAEAVAVKERQEKALAAVNEEVRAAIAQKDSLSASIERMRSAAREALR